tara:strand:+ start:765 stop:1331 length:567 start_codon:yes stop_codon:yes gene_type:complete
MNIIIFGPPGAGKGTQSDFIVKRHDLFHVSTGDLLRNEIKKKTPLGEQISSIVNKGSLVSDEIVSTLIRNVVSIVEYKNRFIFDGYPRNLLQAKNLDKILNENEQKIDLVLKLSVSLDTIKKRILERQVLEKRADDNEEIAIKRFKTYELSTEPVIEYYKKLNILKEINGERSITQINKEISDIIDTI